MTLRAPEPKDVEFIYKCENDPNRLAQGRTGLPLSKLQISRYVENYHAEALASGSVRFMIECDGETAGIVDLYDLDFSASKGFVAIYVDERHRGRGIGKEALAQLASFAVAQLSLVMLVAVVSEANDASVRLFRRAGYDAVALLPQWVRSPGGELISARLFVRHISR